MESHNEDLPMSSWTEAHGGRLFDADIDRGQPTLSKTTWCHWTVTKSEIAQGEEEN